MSTNSVLKKHEPFNDSSLFPYILLTLCSTHISFIHDCNPISSPMLTLSLCSTQLLTKESKWRNKYSNLILTTILFKYYCPPAPQFYRWGNRVIEVTWFTQGHTARLVKAMVFPAVMYGCESWTIKKAEPWRIDAFELWCWRRLFRVPWTARRSN